MKPKNMSLLNEQGGPKNGATLLYSF